MQRVKTYSDINLQTIHNKSKIFQIESTNSFIFNNEILSRINPFETNFKNSKFIEISYLDSIIKNQKIEWIKFSKCIPNHSNNRATYRQSWTISTGSGLNFQLDFSSFLGGFGPSFKIEKNLDFGIGGVIVCEINPDNILQFAILIESFDIENIRYREVKFLKFGLKKKYEKNKGWLTFPKYKLINKNNVQLACFTDPDVQNC